MPIRATADRRAAYFSAARAGSGRASRTRRIRRRALSRLAGMYSVGQYPSCGQEPLSTRRATVAMCTSSTPSAMPMVGAGTCTAWITNLRAGSPPGRRSGSDTLKATTTPEIILLGSMIPG
jgi:hypothetical protein